MPQSFITIAIPFAATKLAAVNALLEAMGNPAREAGRILDRTQLFHFASITALPVADSEAASHLVIELTADEEAAPAIEIFSEILAEKLRELLDKAGIDTRGRPLGQFLLHHRIVVGQGWFSTPGVDFNGTPGMTVARIRQEAELAAQVAAVIDALPRDGTALGTLTRLRSWLWTQDAAKWVFVPESAPLLEPQPATGIGSLSIIGSAIGAFLWPFLLLAALPLLAVLTVEALGWIGVLPPRTLGGAIGVNSALWAGVLIGAAELLGLALLYARLRAREQTDVPDDIAPAKRHVDAIMRHESYTFQNHLAAVSRLKPGSLRRLTLRFGLWIAGVIGGAFSRPGFLGPTGVIHFARWVLVPGTDKLLFFSNYDGAWESYLENFIQEAHAGVTGIWSNTQGFPRTSNLFFGGATDGDRLRRWTRRQQHPTLFWYSAYPKLTLERIRRNSAIRQGIALAGTEAAAADWLACFGSAPAPDDELARGEIPTLAFGGLRRLRFGKCLLLQLPADERRCREWLRAVAPDLSYGTTRGAISAAQLGLAAGGLRKLGLTEEQIATFPVPFQDGMAAPWRARALGDVGENDPRRWRWGGPECGIDAIMIVYAREAAALASLGEQRREEASRFGVEVRRELAFSPVPEGDEPMREAFGFIDGISQPILRGAGPVPRGQADQVVEPGEFILGYRDNGGYLPPSPWVAASDDPESLLPGRDPAPDRQRPNCSLPLPTGERDLGCNGTFLVVRQLEQDRAAFQRFIEEAAARLQREGRMPGDVQAPAAEWIEAKMVGRWRKDGSPLVQHPRCPAAPAPGGPIAPDNSFRFASEDATGRSCPFGAHIRRANPRDTFAADPATALAIVNRHRILRVGRSYASDNEEKAGLVFMCLNADIERQFEFVQQTWLRGPSFQGLEDELDPVLGGKEGEAQFTIPAAEGPVRVKGMKDFVTMRGGGYFFLPGRSAMRFLSRAGKAADRARGESEPQAYAADD